MRKAGLPDKAAAVPQQPAAKPQKVSSPLLGHNCRFTPTCSQYMIQAIQVHGPAKGLLLGRRRILRCNPFGKYGYDPVPEKGRWMNPERKLFREKR